MNADAAALATLDLRRLAELEGAERAFLSLYVSSPAALGQLDDRVARVRAFLADEETEREHFEESLQLARRWLDEEAPQDFTGLAVFASWALDFVEGHVLPLTVPDLLRVECSPYLRPLAELQDEYETFAVVAADNRATRIFVVTAAIAEDEASVRGDVKNRVKKGGWSQKRYARRRENQLLHYAQDVAERLGELAREGAFARIVLLGSDETLREIQEALPTALAEKVVGERAIDLHDGEEVIVDEAFEVYFAAERRAEERLWDTIREEGLSGGLAVTGATKVLAAAAVGRVEAMLVHRDLELRGTRCRDCENVVHGTPDTCQVCGSADVFALDLVEELVHLLEKSSATVDFADPIPGLAEVGGIAALLRY